MKCPKCKHPKTKDDFYWRDRESLTKVRKECKECISKENELKNKLTVVEGYFNIKEFGKFYTF